jgi:hypothetical protein
MSLGRFARLVNWSPLLLASCVASLAYAQTPNPFQSLKDALNKVVKQLPNQPQAQPGALPAGQPGAQPVGQPGATQSSGGAAVPTAAASTSGGGQPWTPPAETAAAVVPFKGPLDPSKLPDIGGVHIGETSEQALAALKKIHPGAQLTQIPQTANMPSAGVTLNFGNSQPPPSWDSTTVNFTFDSNQQTVYSVYRDVGYQPNISRQNLIDALRQKYGKETAAANESYLETNDDAAITKMWWLMDEQGHVQHPSRFDRNTHTPSGCGEANGGADGVSNYRSEAVDYVSGRLPAAKYCDSLITLYAVLERGSSGGSSRLDLVSVSRILLTDAALVRRSIVAMGDAQMGKARQQQQNDLKKANEAKPNL